MSQFISYILSRLDDPTTWIGIIGMVMMIFHFYSALFFLFLLLVVLPEKQFNGIFKEWADKLRKIDFDL